MRNLEREDRVGVQHFRDCLSHLGADVYINSGQTQSTHWCWTEGDGLRNVHGHTDGLKPYYTV
jgi:hypothetical protein